MSVDFAVAMLLVGLMMGFTLGGIFVLWIAVSLCEGQVIRIRRAKVVKEKDGDTSNVKQGYVV
jgi:hypothetical protein